MSIAMNKETRLLCLILGLPMAAAALLLAGGFMLQSLAPQAVHASGAGVDTRNGYSVTTIDAGGGVQYLCVSTYAPYAEDRTMRQFLTFYELERTVQGKAKLHLVGSRCIDFDRGFQEINFESPRGYKPSDLERALNRGRRPAPAGNEPQPPSND